MKKSLIPNNFGKKYLVEQCQKISLKKIFSKYHLDIKKLIASSELEAQGIKIEFITSKTNYGGTRLWFCCPLCKKRIGVLYKHPLSNIFGCRQCLNLDYRKRKYKGMIEENKI